MAISAFFWPSKYGDFGHYFKNKSFIGLALPFLWSPNGNLFQKQKNIN
jgi:hypothetical protein